MDADRPAQPVDPAEPTVVQRRPPAPEQDGQTTAAVDSTGQTAPKEAGSRDAGSKDAGSTEVMGRPAAPVAATEVTAKPEAGAGATEVMRAPPRPAASPAAPTAPVQPGPPIGAGPAGVGPAGVGPAGTFGGPSAPPGYGLPPTASYGPPPTQTAPAYGAGYPQQGAPGYGQQPRPTQMFEQPPMPPPGAPSGAPGPAPRRRGRLIALIVAGVVLLAGVGVGAWLLLRPRYVDPELAKAEVVRVTQTTDELPATDVRCPADAEQEQGATFTCTATVVGKQISYSVQQSDDKGTAFSVRYDRPVLDPKPVQDQIVSKTQSETGVAPTGVTCPGDVHYDKSATFTCTGKIDNQDLKFTITQTDGVGAVSIAYGRVLKAADVAQKLADDLTKQVGQKIVAQCGAVGQTVIVNEPGTPISCRAVNAASPSNAADFTIAVDRSGNIYPA